MTYSICHTSPIDPGPQDAFIKNTSKDTDPESQKLLDIRLQFDLLDIIQAKGKILLVCFTP